MPATAPVFTVTAVQRSRLIKNEQQVSLVDQDPDKSRGSGRLLFRDTRYCHSSGSLSARLPTSLMRLDSICAPNEVEHTPSLLSVL